MKQRIIILFILSLFLNACQKDKQNELTNTVILMNEAFTETVEVTYNRTLSSYDRIGLLNIERSDKYGVLYDEVMEIKSETNVLILKIEKFKQEIMAESEGREYDPNAHVSLNKLQNKNDNTSARKVMFKGAEFNKADSLELWLNDYRRFMIAKVDDCPPLYNWIDSALSTKDVMIGSNQMQKWEDIYFDGVPIVGSIGLLTKLQADIRSAEFVVVERFMQGTEPHYSTIITAKAVVEMEKSCIKRGGELKASIFPVAYDSTMNPLVYCSTKYPFYDTILEKGSVTTYEMLGVKGIDYGILPVTNGKAIFSVENVTEPGEHQFGGYIQWENQFGNWKFPYVATYYVVE